MKILINREVLEEMLVSLSGGVSTKNLQILSFVLIEALDKKVRFTVTDLDITITHTKNSNIQEKGSICVPFKNIVSIVKFLPNSEVVLDAHDNKLWIRCERCEYVLNGVGKESFPKIPQSREKQAVKILADDLRDMVNLTSFCVLMGESNFMLSGVLFEFNKDEFSLVATDGKRLAKASRKMASDQADLSDKVAFILPLKTVMELNHSLKKQEYVFVGFGKKQVEFDMGDILINSRVIEGEFPDYEKYIPQESDSKLCVEKENFLAVLRRANTLSTADYKGVKIEIKKDYLVISKSTPDLGEYREDLAGVEYSGREIVLGFNPEYLIDVLKNANQARICLDIYGPEKPIVLRSAGYLYLALPMRLD